MNLEKKDLRVKKTILSLSTALLKLLEEKSFNKITVNDICEEAMVGRSTFYVYFEDKYKLLKYSLNELRSKLWDDEENLEMRDVIYISMKNIEKNKNIFKNILIGNNDLEVTNMLQLKFSMELKKIVSKNLNENIFPETMDIILMYYSSGIVGVITYWILNKVDYSVEEVSDCLYELITAGKFFPELYKLMGKNCST